MISRCTVLHQQICCLICDAVLNTMHMAVRKTEKVPV